MELSGIKLICLDMDGTLFSSHEQIPEINLNALKECVRRGIRVALVSGRNYRFLTEHALKIDESVIIVSSNGARIDECAGGRCLYEGTFTPEGGIEAIKSFLELNIYFEVYTADINYIFRSGLVTSAHRRSLDRYLLNGHVLGTVVLDKLPETPIEGIYKLVAFTEDNEKLERAREMLDGMGIKHVSSGSQNIEIMSKGVGKGEAIGRLCDLLGIDAADVMAFGDYTNDLDMIKAAGHGVAMMNGVDVLKQAAEIIAPPNTEGGVGQVIYKYILGE